MPAGVDATVPEQRVLEAAAVLPAWGAVTGWAALRWFGARWIDGLAEGGRVARPVFLVTGSSNIRDQPGVRHTEDALPPGDFVMFDGIRVTTPVRSVFFEMVRAPSLREAVRVGCMAAFNDLVSVAELSAYVDSAGPVTGIGRARDAVALVHENCWSPAEVDLMLAWRVDAGLPPPPMNVPIFDRAGRHLATPDLLDEEAGVGGEYDGELHLVGQQRARDVVREELMRGVGLEYFTMLREDRLDSAAVVGRMRATRGRAAFAPPHERPWTVTPPPGWLPTVTVEQRRALAASERDRLLAHRRLAG